MSKYTYEYKLTAVETYLTGTEGVIQIAGRCGISEAHLREWVASYRIHGAVGLAKKFSHYSAEFKLSVLKYMWDNKLSRRETVALYNIRSRSCLREWERRYQAGGIRALAPGKRGSRKTMTDNKPPPDIPDEQKTKEQLLKELQQLRMEHAYLKKVDALVRAREAQKKRK